MRFLPCFAVAGLLLCHGALAQSAAPAASCQQALAEVTAEWHAANFAVPQKPSQLRVLGAGGRVSSGPEIAFMQREIRTAAQECAAAADPTPSLAADALQRLSVVRAMLRPPVRAEG